VPRVVVVVGVRPVVMAMTLHHGLAGMDAAVVETQRVPLADANERQCRCLGIHGHEGRRRAALGRRPAREVGAAAPFGLSLDDRARSCLDFVYAKASGGGLIFAPPKAKPSSASHKNPGFGRKSPLPGEEGATHLQDLDLKQVLAVLRESCATVLFPKPRPRCRNRTEKSRQPRRGAGAAKGARCVDGRL